MNEISAIIITRNEESNIERCLNSLVGVADEIVVVDSYSEDATVEICRRYGCRISQRPFSGFGSQRQYAMGLASFPYVLSIDADETLSEELRDNILALKSGAKFAHRMYAVEVVSYFCGRAMRASGWEPVREVRLFDRRYACWDLRDVYERLSYPDSVSPSLLCGQLNHYRSNTPGEYRRKEVRQSDLHARVLAAQNRRVGLLTPLWRAVGRYLDCHLRHYALRDGTAGNTIANGHFVFTLRSYRAARKLQATT